MLRLCNTAGVGRQSRSLDKRFQGYTGDYEAVDCHITVFAIATGLEDQLSSVVWEFVGIITLPVTEKDCTGLQGPSSLGGPFGSLEERMGGLAPNSRWEPDGRLDQRQFPKGPPD